MNNFKVGDEVVCIDDSTFASVVKDGKYIVDDVNRSGDIKLSGIETLHYYAKNKFVLYRKKDTEKNSKPHTETDRRKAAKSVRELQEKLKKACDKAKEVGIKVKFQNACVDLIDIEMTYQPETPKMRKY